MQGCQITFFTQQGRRHGHQPIADWLLGLARECGLQGATVVAGAKGIGHDGQLHSAGFIDLADQPQMVIMTATAAQADALLARIQAEDLRLFFVRSPVEFGVLGRSAG
jgi:PII-like signaling protein